MLLRLSLCIESWRLTIKNMFFQNKYFRSGTSIGANVSEATEAQSKADFVHKLSIALKEARETEYWIRLLIGAEYISSSIPLKEDINEIIRILTAIIKTSKNN